MTELPYDAPRRLASLVARLTYNPDRKVRLDVKPQYRATWLIVDAISLDTYHPRVEGELAPRIFTHRMPVPPDPYNSLPERYWERWLLDQLILVEQHEVCEWFTIDGVRPYDPHAGDDVYAIRRVP